MFIDRNVRLRVSPEKFQNDAYDIVNLFYKGSVLRVRPDGESPGDTPPGDTSPGDTPPIAAGCDLINVTQTGDLFHIEALFNDPQGGAPQSGDPHGNDPQGGDLRGGIIRATASSARGGIVRAIASSAPGGPKNRAYSLKMALYRLLKARASLESGTEISLPWGALVGIRPVKIYAGLAADGAGRAEIIAEMKRAYDVPEKSSELCLQIAAAQREIVEKYNPRTDYMLYIGIPFCASRCAYCSFPSDAHNKAEKYAAQYIDALLKEIYYIAGYMENAEMRLKAVYIGGGTPTALAAPELRKLLDGVSDAFGGESPDEYTVEAGRADTMDCDKLNVIRNSAKIAKRLRLCVNPQTMNARTLELVGRSHTPEDVVKAYRLARESGFDDINMDIIAGLPGETAADFINTLDAVFNLGPDSVTSHTLCIKRSSRINEYRERYMCPEAAVTEAMQEDARRRAAGAGMRPYYLYRQKNTAGGLANVGYAIKGRECVYNVHEMADRIDILAAGAGAVSKFVYPGESRVERVFNVKNLLEYISRIDEMTRRKTAFLAAACERRR